MVHWWLRIDHAMKGHCILSNGQKNFKDNVSILYYRVETQKRGSCKRTVCPLIYNPGQKPQLYECNVATSRLELKFSSFVLVLNLKLNIYIPRYLNTCLACWEVFKFI